MAEKKASKDQQATNNGEHDKHDDHSNAQDDAKAKGGVRFEEQLEKLRSELETTKKKSEENWDKALRAIAELENTKRRAERDVENAHKFALERFTQDLLPVIDSMEKAVQIDSHDEQSKAMKEGVELTSKMLLDVLAKHGVSQLDPADELFDPNHHEAMSALPHPDKADNTVINVIQRGYKLNDRLVRPARVVVCKNNQEQNK